MTNKDQINRFKDYADCADASYAILNYVFENEANEVYDNIFNIERWKDADSIIFGDKNKDFNTAYARCIEARFMQDVVIDKGTFKGSTISNDPKKFYLTLHCLYALKTL